MKNEHQQVRIQWHAYRGSCSKHAALGMAVVGQYSLVTSVSTHRTGLRPGGTAMRATYVS